MKHQFSVLTYSPLTKFLFSPSQIVCQFSLKICASTFPVPIIRYMIAMKIFEIIYEFKFLFFLCISHYIRRVWGLFCRDMGSNGLHYVQINFQVSFIMILFPIFECFPRSGCKELCGKNLCNV